MLRNYVSDTKTNLEDNSIIINKYLITKPINTKNLEISFIKKVEQENYTESYDCNTFKIVIHINNPFNPTGINLINNKNNIHIYQLPGDSTLHINIGILTLFKIISSDSNLIKLRKKSNKEKDYLLSNSNLSFFITELIKTQNITSYKKDQSGNLVSDLEYSLSDFENFDPLKFTYSSETNSF